MATQSSAWTGEKPRKAGNGAGRGSAARSGEKVVRISPTGSEQDIHRTPPHSVEAEQGVLGSMLISPREIIAECVEKITEEYFYVPAHRTIYNVLVDLWNAGQAIDLITFTQVLRDRSLLESVGGAAFVTSLFTFVPTAANVGYYVDIVRDKYILREIIAAATESVRRAYDEQDEVSILELRAKARRLKAQQDVQLIIIDYLQLLRSTSRRAQDNRQLEISEISAGIKGLAKELKIPIVVVAQLNRQPEQRTGGKPRLSDLRESGSIEQDADLVGLLVRPEIYEEDEEARAEKAGEAELIIAKQRNGPVGEIPLTFLKEFTRFETRARNVSEPEEGF